MANYSELRLQSLFLTKGKDELQQKASELYWEYDESNGLMSGIAVVQVLEL